MSSDRTTTLFSSQSMLDRNQNRRQTDHKRHTPTCWCSCCGRLLFRCCVGNPGSTLGWSHCDKFLQLLRSQTQQIVRLAARYFLSQCYTTCRGVPPLDRGHLWPGTDHYLRQTFAYNQRRPVRWRSAISLLLLLLLLRGSLVEAVAWSWKTPQGVRVCVRPFNIHPSQSQQPFSVLKKKIEIRPNNFEDMQSVGKLTLIIQAPFPFK